MMLYALSSHASKTDSTFQRNQIGISVTNAMSQEFFDGPGHKPTISPASYFHNNVTSVHYLPAYAFHLQIRYTLGISHGFGIETGLGYMLNMTMYNMDNAAPGGPEVRTEHMLATLGYITLPLYVKYTKAIHKGALSFKLGPDFSLPVNNRFEYTNYQIPGGSPSNELYTHRFKTSETSQYATMGACAGMSYEKKLRHSMSVAVGPVLDFFNLAQFHRHDIFSNSSGYRTYQYYIGLDVAFNFGMHFITKSGRF